MRVGTSAGVVAALLLMVISGCSGKESEGPAPAGKGRITGHVLDESGLGIEDALVQILLTSRAATTDASGSFAFDDVDAGAARLAASADGYLTSTRRVTVPDGGSLRIDFPLQSVPTVTPFHRTLDFPGTLSCGLPQGTGCPEGLAGAEAIHRFEVEPGLAGMIVELVWTPTVSGLASSLAFQVHGATATQCGAVYDEASGPSPVSLQVDQGYPISGGHNCVSVHPAQDSAVAEQDYMVYVSLFYHGPPEPGFTGVP